MFEKVEQVVQLDKGRDDGKVECNPRCGFHLGGRCILDNLVTDAGGHPQRFSPQRDGKTVSSRPCPAEGAYKVTIERWRWLS